MQLQSSKENILMTFALTSTNSLFSSTSQHSSENCTENCKISFTLKGRKERAFQSEKRVSHTQKESLQVLIFNESLFNHLRARRNDDE